ncbi:hypothetical protein Tco_0299447 [Tanacetum coccineum]
MHAVPPPMTRIYIPSGPDKEIDDSQFTYGLNQSKPSESDARSSDFNSCESNCSEETHESMPEPVVNEPKVVSEPKVWSAAPIIEEYESDSEDEHVSTYERTGNTYFSHLIRDCDFHEKRMAKQVELNNRTTVLTRNGKILVNTARTSGTNTVNTARHNFNSLAVPINAARKVNTVKPIVNTAEVNAVSAVKGKRETAVKSSTGCNWRPKRHYWHKVSKYNGGSSPRNCATFEDPPGRLKPKKAWVPKRIQSLLFNVQDYPQRALQNKGIVDSGCSRHMTGNKAYLDEYQDFNGGPVAFGRSKGYITGKGFSSWLLLLV